jgi:hypothetical protein
MNLTDKPLLLSSHPNSQYYTRDFASFLWHF